MPVEQPPSQPLPWKGSDILLPLVLFMPAASVAAIHGDRAAMLGIPGAGLAQCSHWLMLSVFVVVPLFLAATRMKQGAKDALTMLAAFAVMSFPAWLFSVGSSSIPLSRLLNQEEVMELRTTFRMPTLQTDDGSEGPALKLQAAYDTEAVRQHLRSIGVMENAPLLPR